MSRQKDGKNKIHPRQPTIQWAPEAFIYGRVLVAGDLNATAHGKRDVLVDGTFVYTDTNDNVVNIGDLLNAGDHTITASFTPDHKNYKNATADVIIVVNKSPVSIAFTNTENTYGEEITATELNAVAHDYYDSVIGGTFEYTYGDNTVISVGDILDAGDYDVTVSFTPTASDNYEL